MLIYDEEEGTNIELMPISEINAPLIEESEDFCSKDYKHYKPYSLPRPYKNYKNFYNYQEYIEYTDGSRMKVKNCHMCDIRKSGCGGLNWPRYYCKKDKKEIQTNLFEF